MLDKDVKIDIKTKYILRVPEAKFKISVTVDADNRLTAVSVKERGKKVQKFKGPDKIIPEIRSAVLDSLPFVKNYGFFIKHNSNVLLKFYDFLLMGSIFISHDGMYEIMVPNYPGRIVVSPERIFEKISLFGLGISFTLDEWSTSCYDEVFSYKNIKIAYDTLALLALPVTGGSRNYLFVNPILDWLVSVRESGYGVE